MKLEVGLFSENYFLRGEDERVLRGPRAPAPAAVLVNTRSIAQDRNGGAPLACSLACFGCGVR